MEHKRDLIIKALECCQIRGIENHCDECIFHNNYSEPLCRALLCGKSRNLIHELTEENDKLASALAEYDRITEVRIAEEYVTADAYEELREENERLKNVEFTCGFIKPHKVLECPIFDEVERTRADTVREMHSKIKDRCIKGGIYPAFVRSTIEQIAREMIGEENGNQEN